MGIALFAISITCTPTPPSHTTFSHNNHLSFTPFFQHQNLFSRLRNYQHRRSKSCGLVLKHELQAAIAMMSSQLSPIRVNVKSGPSDGSSCGPTTITPSDKGVQAICNGRAVSGTCPSEYYLMTAYFTYLIPGDPAPRPGSPNIEGDTATAAVSGGYAELDLQLTCVSALFS